MKPGPSTALPGSSNLTRKTAVDEVVVSGDAAFVRVSFDGYLRPKVDDGSPPLRSVSRHIWILRRQTDGNWKIARDIWNTPKVAG